MIWKRENIWYERGNKNDKKEGNKNGMKEVNKNGMKEGNRNAMRERNRNGMKEKTEMIWKRETKIISEGETEMIKRGKQIFYESPTTCHAFRVNWTLHSRVHLSLNFIKRRNCNGYFQGSYWIIVIYCM